MANEPKWLPWRVPHPSRLPDMNALRKYFCVSVLCDGALACGADNERGDYVGGVAVERDPGAVVAHRGSRVGVGGGFLDIAQRDTGVEGGGDESVAQRVGAGVLVDPSRLRDAAHDPGCGVTIQSATVVAEENGALKPFTHDKINRPRAVRGARGMVTVLPPLRSTVSARCRRSRARSSIRAPIASETRSPFNASSEISA